MESKMNDCTKAGCSEKIRKLHVAQIKRGWNPHPPERFVTWWNSTGMKKTETQTDRGWNGVDAVRAFNCEEVREVYRETKSYGIA